MNIIINNYCNYKCEYCFANKVIEKDKNNMSLENFKYILKFLEKSNMHEARLIGGEPTLHPNFDDFIIECLLDDNIRDIMIFTNGSYDEKVRKILNKAAHRKKINILLNYNSPEIIGEKINKITIENIENAIKNGIGVTLGLNIYKENQNCKYIIETAKKYNMNHIRCSIAVPNDDKKIDTAEYFGQYIESFIKFVEECYINDITVGIDCNKIPICVLSDDILRYLMMIDPKLLEIPFCSPVIDIQPDLTVIRCFAMSDYPVKLEDFNNAKEIEKYFIDNFDKKINKPIFNECEKCPTYILKNKSCSCLKFSINK